MNKLLKTALVILALLILIGSLAAWFLPTAVEALPGQVRGRLPEQFLRAVTTPLPAALPPPAATPAGVETIINEINQSPVPKTEPVEVESVQVEPATPTPEAEPVEAKLATPTPKAEPVEAVPVEADPATRHSPLATPTPEAEPVEAVPVEAEPVEPATRHSPLATPLTPPYPPQTKLEGLEIVPQKLNNCGPATLSINLNYYGLKQSQFDVAQVVKPRYDDRNVSPEELVDYTNGYTELRAALFRGGSLDLAKQLIAAGFPVVIEKGYEPDEWQGWMGHYLTLFGYDDKAQAFITMDTYLGPWDSNGRSYSYEEIETGWQQFNHTFYIVYEPEQEQTLREITGPTFNDEQTMWQQTITQAQADIEQDPQNAFAWFNLGSSLTNLGQLSADHRLTNAAATAFDQSRLRGLPPRMLWYQFEIYEAYLAAGRVEEVMTLTAAVLENAGGRDVEETYLYRGHAYMAQGDPAAAKADYRRALELKPGFTAAIEGLESNE